MYSHALYIKVASIMCRRVHWHLYAFVAYFFLFFVTEYPKENLKIKYKRNVPKFDALLTLFTVSAINSD